MSGEVFEAQVGKILELRRRLEGSSIVDSFQKALGGALQSGSGPLDVLRRISDLAVAAIEESLYAEFSADRIDESKARDAYDKLSDALGVEAWRVVFVTTNYDPSIEIGLAAIGRQFATGFAAPGVDQPEQLEPQNMTTRALSEARTPILHLHGAVGWYVRNYVTGSGLVQRIVKLPSDGRPTRDPDYTPALLLPDPKKEPIGDPLLQPVWREFEQNILRGAKYILVVGHGLNDSALTRAIEVTAIKGHSVPVGVGTVEPDRVGSKVAKVLPGAEVFLMEFSAGFDTGDFLDWRRKHHV